MRAAAARPAPAVSPTAVSPTAASPAVTAAAPAQAPVQAPAPAPAPVQAPAPARDADRPRAIRRLLVERLARTLRVSAADLSPSVAFSDLGVDSITGSTFATQIGEELGVELNAAALYDFTSIERLADHLLDLTDAQEPAGPVAQPPAAQPPEPAQPPAPDDLIALLEARFAAGELSAAEVLDLLDAELATKEPR